MAASPGHAGNVPIYGAGGGGPRQGPAAKQAVRTATTNPANAPTDIAACARTPDGLGRIAKSTDRRRPRLTAPTSSVDRG